MFNKPQILNAFPEIIAAESTRHGGVSPEPYSSLNLSLYTSDDPQNVTENRRIFFTGLGFSEEETAGSYQVHGDKVFHVIQPGQVKGYDALITNRKGIFLAVTIADCTPVLIYDSENQAVAAIHAGWRGTVAEVVKNTLKTMKDCFGTNPKWCFSYIGTCIDTNSYEVDADVADHFACDFKKWDEKRGKFLVDLKKTNHVQLLESGVPEGQIEVSPYSTFLNNEDYFSHRKEKGRTGRMLAGIGLIDVWH